MSKPPNITNDAEAWRALLRNRGRLGQGDMTLGQFWDEALAIVDIMDELTHRDPTDDGLGPYDPGMTRLIDQLIAAGPNVRLSIVTEPPLNAQGVAL